MLEAMVRGISKVSEFSGTVFSWLVLALIGTITYDVGARYLFSAPTAWSYDISYMIGGGFMVLGGAYTLLHRGHVRVDVIYNKLSLRGQSILDAILTLFFLIPLLSIILYYAVQYAWNSLVTNELSSMGTTFRPIMWPFRWALVLAVALFLLQGLAWFVEQVFLIKEGRPHD